MFDAARGARSVSASFHSSQVRPLTMTPLTQMSVDELNRILTGSKWLLGSLAVLTALAGIFNQWVTDRVARLQAAAKVESQKRLESSEAELRLTKEKTIRLETRLAHRSLSDSQWAILSAGLTQYAGTQFEFTSYQDDAEVRGLVMPMIKGLLSAGWKGLPARDFLMASLVEGVVIEYAPESAKTLGPPARALCDALNAKRISTTIAPNSELTGFGDRLKIKVGKKPTQGW